MSSYYNIPSITIKNDDELILGTLPRIVLLEPHKWIKHVYYYGDAPYAHRKHVLSYTYNEKAKERKVTMKCSEPNCVVNAPIYFYKLLDESKSKNEI